MHGFEPAGGRVRNRRLACTRIAGLVLGLAVAALNPQGLPETHAGLLAGKFAAPIPHWRRRDHDGAPDFWHQGRSAVSIDAWTTNLAVSPAHSFQLNDTLLGGAYGEWYPTCSASPPTLFDFRYNLRYVVPNSGAMQSRSSYNPTGTLLSSLSYAFAEVRTIFEEYYNSSSPLPPPKSWG